jgi:hypothetical protein
MEALVIEYIDLARGIDNTEGIARRSSPRGPPRRAAIRLPCKEFDRSWHLILDTKRQEAVDQGLAHSHRTTYES